MQIFIYNIYFQAFNLYADKIQLKKEFGHNLPFYYGAVVGTGEVRGTIKKEKVGS